jgi:hypothetical protein
LGIRNGDITPRLYQITQSRKKIVFWLDKFLVKDISDGFKVIASGVVDEKIKLYSFKKFSTSS